LEAACRRLGLSSSGLYALGFPDTAAPTCGSVFDLAVSTILGIVDQTQASTLFVTWAGDPHCDHRSAALLAAQARRLRPSLKLFAYPIWGWHLDAAEAVSEAPPRGFRIDISGVKDIKRAAIAAHASQMTDMIPDDPDGFQLTEEVLAPFLGDYEYFLEVPDVG
jgi:LmbE family N-acetylglucosaminyl deacetylase